MKISNGAYNLSLLMESERIRLNGRLALLFSNTYKIDEVFQDKVQSFSEPIEVSCLLEYSDGYEKSENEAGHEVTVTATATIAKEELNRLDTFLQEGDYIKIDNRLKTDNQDEDENFDDYDTFVIKSVKPKVVEGQYLDRIISYECELSDISSRSFDDEL